MKRPYMQLQPEPHDLRKSLTDAVRCRILSSDQPVSILASGGLDSSIIIGLAKEQGLLDRVEIFYIPNTEDDDYIEDAIPNGANFLPLTPPKTYDLETILRANEGPVDLGSMIPQYILAEVVAWKGYHVSIGGDGADELFGGYRRALEYDSQLSDVFSELPYYHLPRLDKLMMSQTVEHRCPFLSQRVIQCALGIPYTHRRGKSVLKSTFADVVPDRILKRPKRPLKSREVEHGGIRWSRKLAALYLHQIMNVNTPIVAEDF